PTQPHHSPKSDPPPATNIAQHLHIRQEVHLDRLDTLTLARLATPARCVEREPARGITPDPSFSRTFEDTANVIPEPDVRGGTGARCLSNRCLVHFQHAIDVLDTSDGTPTREPPGLGRLAAA